MSLGGGSAGLPEDIPGEYGEQHEEETGGAMRSLLSAIAHSRLLNTQWPELTGMARDESGETSGKADPTDGPRKLFHRSCNIEVATRLIHHRANVCGQTVHSIPANVLPFYK
jgi:hypothetical protein